MSSTSTKRRRELDDNDGRSRNCGVGDEASPLHRRHRHDNDRVRINVGGTVFETSKSNLCLHSTFFKSRFSSDWDEEENVEQKEEEDIMFIDQDADTFKVMLEYFRQGMIESSKLTRQVLLQIVFFGVDELMRDIKIASYRHVHAQYGPTTNDSQESVIQNDERYDDDDYVVSKFDELYGTITDALQKGFLPKNIQGGSKEFAAIVVHRRSAATTARGADWHVLNTLVSSLDVPKRLIERNTLKNAWKAAMLSKSEDSDIHHSGAVDDPTSGRGTFHCSTFLDGLQLLQICGFTTVEM